VKPTQATVPVSLMDTTLRDGEQTPNVAFSVRDKLAIARALLCDVRVDRIEIGSARVSPGEKHAARRVAEFAKAHGLGGRVEMLAFCDGNRSVDWVREVGVERINLLVKGSERHCRLQLGLDLGRHLDAVARTLESAARAGVALSGVYLEDWSRGVRESPAYVARLTAGLSELGVRRVYLADTLGVLEPGAVSRYVRRMCRRFPELSFEFHGHDDYGLATANALAAVRAGARGLHVTVNGMGERAGNVCLSELCPALTDLAGCTTSVDETQLCRVSELVARASGCPVPRRAPVVGEHVFTQTAGVHADGDAKADLYAGRLAPERFGRQRAYALGKLCGRASLEHHLSALGLVLEPERLAALLAVVVARGDRKCRVLREDLPELIRGLDTPRAAKRGRAAPSAGNGRKKTLMSKGVVGYAGPRARSSARVER
jgi:(R)-citramalate synthase